MIRLGFIDYIRAISTVDCKMVFPQMDSPNNDSFASTFYKSTFKRWRDGPFQMERRGPMRTEVCGRTRTSIAAAEPQRRC